MPPKAVPGATGAPQLSVETALQQPMDLAAAAQEAPGRAETRGRCVEVGDGAQGARDVASAAVTKESGGAAPRAPKGTGRAVDVFGKGGESAEVNTRIIRVSGALS